MEKYKIQNGKVVRLYPVQSTPEAMFKLPPPEPISEHVTRQILASQITKVAGPEPINGGTFVLVSAIVIVIVSVAYSMVTNSVAL